MAKSIGNLHVKLSLNSRPFTTGMQRAADVTKRVTGGIARAGVQVAKYGAVAAGVAAAGVLALTKSQMSAIDTAAKTADKLGVTTESLIGLRHAAEMSGVAAGTLDVAMQRMIRRLAEAADGGGPAAAAIERMGLDAAELSRKSPEQALGDIADAMNELPGPADRVRAAFALFDSEGVALVNTLANGSAGLREAQAETERFGTALTRVDAAKVELANDAIARVGVAAKGAGQSLTVELAPYIEAAATRMLALGTNGAHSGERISSAMEWVGNAVATVADYLSLGKAAFFGLQGAATKALEWIVRGLGAIPRAFRLMQYGATSAIAVIVRGFDKLEAAVVAAAEWLGIDIQRSQFFESFARELDRAAADALEKAGQRNVMDDFADDLAQEAGKSFKRADQAIDDWVSGAAGQNVKATFAEIKADAQARAEEIANQAAKRAELARAADDVMAEINGERARAEEKGRERETTVHLAPLELLESGSAEAQRVAFEAIADSIRAPTATQDPDKQQVAEQRKTNNILGNLERLLRDQQRVEVVSL